MAKTSFRDWWASRTIRFNAISGAVASALVPLVIAMEKHDWQVLGFSPKWALVIALVAKVFSDVKNMELRSKTNRPIKGRADRCSGSPGC